jgi:hypothetical protein
MRHIYRRTPAAITFVSMWPLPSSNHIHGNNSVMPPDLRSAWLHNAPVATLYE